MARTTTKGSKVVTLKEAKDLAHRLVWKGSHGERTTMINAEDVCNILGKDRPVDSIDTEDVDEMVFKLEDRGLSLSTINKKISALSTILRVCMERGYIEKKPKLTFRKVVNGRIRWVTEKEEETILYLCEQWGLSDVADLIKVAIDTGMRKGELLRMEVRDYNPHTRMITAWFTKNNEQRSIPATKRVHEVLVRRSQDCLPTAVIFGGIDEWRLRNVWDRIRRHMKLTDDKEFVFHTLRHTCASRMAMEGVPLVMIQKFMGHKTIQMTLRYSHLSPDSLNAARDALEQRQKRSEEKEETAQVAEVVEFRPAAQM